MSSALQFTDLIIPNGGINETRSPQELKSNQWTAGTNVEPLFDGCRRRNGSTASNETLDANSVNVDAIQAIVESHEAGTDDREFNSGSTVHISQSFKNAAALSIIRVAVRLKIDNGTPANPVTCAIFSDDGGSPGKPSAVVTDLDTTDFTSVASASITSEYKWFFFTVPKKVDLTANTTYHLVITHALAGGTGTGNYAIEEVTTPSGYANGNVSTSTDKSTWVAVSAADLNFRIYSGTAPITMIADYRLSDAATAFHLVAADGELYKNVSGTMTAVSARDRLTLTAGGDILPTWGVANDRFVFTNDNEISKMFYSLSGTEYYENEGIAAPTTVPTVGVSGSGNNLTEGVWEIDYFFWNDDIGVASDRKYNGVSAASTTVTATGEQIDISGLPAVPERENDRVTHIRIEAKGPAQTIFRYVKQITIGTTSTTLTDSDFTDTADHLPTGVEAEYEHAVAPIHKLKAVAENRQFIADVTDAPYRLMFSPIIGVTPHYHSFPTVNKRDFGKGDGDYITALAFIPPRTLVVGMKNSIRAIDARRPATSDVITITKNVGIAGSHSLQVVGKKLYFLSDADQNKGAFVLDSFSNGSEPRPLFGTDFGIDNTYKSLNPTRMKYSSAAHLSPGDTRYQVWFLVSSGGQADHDRVLVFDYVLQAWAVYTKPSNGANILGHVEEASVSKIYLGGNEGVEHLQDNGTGDSGIAFSSNFTLPVYDMGANHIKKRMRWVDYIVSAQTLGGIALTGSMDYGTSPAVMATLQQISAGGSGVWGDATGPPDWDITSTWSSGADLIGRERLEGRGRTFQPTLSFSQTKVSGNTFHLKGIAFGYQLLRNKVA